MKHPGSPRHKPRVICGTDFSMHAAEAADVAAALARRSGHRLVLVHAVDGAALAASHPETHAEVVAQCRERLRAEAGRVRRGGAVVQEQLETGSPHRALVGAAAKESAQLIVVASLGHIALTQFIVGSVAERTAEAAPVPTLVVRDPKPLLAWARGRRNLRVLLAHDFSVTADAALAWLRKLQQVGSCDLVVAHVAWPPREMQRLGVGGPVSLTGNPALVTRVLERDLAERVAAVWGSQPVALRVPAGWGRTDAQLVELARAEQADLLVVGTHQRHGLSRLRLGSVSRGVLHHASTNVAVVPVPAPGSEPALVPEFHRVLVSTDFSDAGNRAIPFAYAALRRGGTVHLLHVVEPYALPSPLIPRYEPRRPTERQHRRRMHELAARLQRLIPAGAEARGVITEVHVAEHRAVADGICQEAERFGADLICLGSHGRSGLSRATFGSVAQKVMTRSPRPVLVVRPPKP